MADLGACHREDDLCRNATDGPTGDSHFLKAQRADQLDGVFGQGWGAVRALARGQADAAVVEDDDLETVRRESIEKGRIPRVHVPAEALAQHDRIARSNRPVGKPAAADLDVPIWGQDGAWLGSDWEHC